MDQISQALLLGAAGDEVMFTRSTFTRIVSGSGTLNPPTGARAMRVAAIGGGGGGSAGYYSIYLVKYRASGGGGGGCVATKIIPASNIDYSIGIGGIGRGSKSTSAIGDSGGDTSATINGVSMIAYGGKGGDGFAAGGGSSTSSIGAFRRTGGQGGYSSRTKYSSSIRAGGGGAAGPMGNGGMGAYVSFNNLSSGVFVESVAATDGGLLPDGWGCGGGNGGFTRALSASDGSTNYANGGGGAGAASGSYLSPYYQSWLDDHTNMLWGKGSKANITNLAHGGEMGGGGGASWQSTSAVIVGNGGSGGLVVEWFYTD